jgi:glycosyltransferase involved in cell wall biosynthesis
MIHTTIYKEFCEKVPSILVASDAYSMAAKKWVLQSTSIKLKIRGLVESVFLKNYEKYMYPRFDEVCTVSIIDTKYLSKISTASNVSTIGISVSPEYTNLKRNHSNYLFEKKILCSGSLNHAGIADNIIYFLQNNLTIIREACPGTKVTILGKNPTTRLKKVMNNITDLECIDYVENYAEFLNQNWVYIYSQNCSTGLQTKVQQAMSIGLPVVGYDCAFNGLAVEDGKHCLICKNTGQMTNGVIKLLKDESLCRELGSNAAKNIKKLYSIDKIGREMLEKYENILTKYE